MGNPAQLDQGTGLGVNCLEFAEILWIRIGGVNNRCLQSPRSITSWRPETIDYGIRFSSVVVTGFERAAKSANE